VAEDIDGEDQVMRSDITGILLEGSPDRDTLKKLFDYDPGSKDYKLTANFFSYLHPDNLEKAFLSHLAQLENNGMSQYGQLLMK